ncbi:ribonuclease E inhibitor RraB [Aureisphaera galaxeae]|uniref:ribonuclease E inhibitor RraB n=1 Tax=Aureisphaera galaxeae TaxID=1538023 RepID=UPI002350A468|nr:ribonuclease E inhibitor RraB [Aureisphaera galaxeae]MDC8005341.1 ribonuclease E inhibitor RraB [Aureisphaera galaxeae]
MITKEIIREFFANLESGNEFDTSTELMWGYFFLDSNLNRLKRFGDEMKGKGYRFVDIFKAEMESQEDPKEYYLHVERIEYHNTETLHERNQMFYKLVQEKGIGFYDGFDVGNIIK